MSRALPWVTTWALLLASTPAAAQRDAEAEARALFESGIEYRDQERWGEAHEYFRRSWELVRRPSTAFNLAVVLLRLARPTEAVRALDDYLRLADPEQEEARRAEARRMLELALASTGRLTLTVEPTTAVVRIDGARVGGEGAVREITMDPGRHNVRVEADGYEPEALEVAVLDGETTRRSVTLRPRPAPSGPATLRVTSSIASAAIRVDREVVGQGTWVGEIDPGRHLVEVAAQDYVPFRRTIEVSAGETVELQASLSRPEGGLLSEPLFWIVAGVIVVGAGLGIGLAVGGGVEDPYPGTTGVVLQGLRSP